MPSLPRAKFPKDFLWGASTASHQVEGDTVNQWSVWELAHAADLAAGAEKRLAANPLTAPIIRSADWQRIKPLATDPANYVSGQGVAHYERYTEDFDLLGRLNMNSFRFGIEWSRLQPKEGAWDAAAIAHYHQYLDALLQRGITPVLTIWHWTMPTWFTDKGGFEKKDNLPLFAAYVTKLAEEYGDKLKYVVTLNEPNVYVSFSYATGEWPPQQRKPLLAFTVYRNLAAAHKQAYAILKAANPALQVGVAHNLGAILPKRPHNHLDVTSTKLMSYAWNWYFLNRIKRQQDFIGVNYYFTDYFQNFGSKRSPHVPASDVGWYLEPEGLYGVLAEAWRRYRKPLIVTENGLADSTDSLRHWWLSQTTVAMQRALDEGVDLRGYLHWSLLDNFEWSLGWWPKFGLVAVDREHGMRRKPRPSALWWAEQIAGWRGLDRVANEKRPSAAAPPTSAPVPAPRPAPRASLPVTTAAAPATRTPKPQATSKPPVQPLASEQPGLARRFKLQTGKPRRSRRIQ